MGSLRKPGSLENSLEAGRRSLSAAALDRAEGRGAPSRAVPTQVPEAARGDRRLGSLSFGLRGNTPVDEKPLAELSI